MREIKNMLSTGSVDGIFMDKYTFMHVVSFAKGILLVLNIILSN